jgi:hypothetical protein
MPQEPGNQHRHALTTTQVSRAVDSYLRFVEDVWGRSFRVVATGWLDVMRIADVAALTPFNSERLFSRLLTTYANSLSGIGVGVSAGAELAAAKLRDDAQHVRTDYAPGTGRGVPREVGTMREVPGERPDMPKPFTFPSRVIDASQGWAAYVVPCDVAAAVLGPDRNFVAPFDLGGGRTLLVVSGSDYRVGDLGSYREIALALSVNPVVDQTGPPGTMFVGFVVSGEFTSETSRRFWGLEKVVRRDLAVSYGPRRVWFGLTDNQDALAVSFPRFGRLSSDSIPVPVYSRLTGAGAEPAIPLVSLLTRSGRGEGLQIGGSVSIRLGTANVGGCVCRGSTDCCLCQRLEQFGIKDRLPAANGWSEHISGTLDAPQPLRLSHSGTAPDGHA